MSISWSDKLMHPFSLINKTEKQNTNGFCSNCCNNEIDNKITSTRDRAFQSASFTASPEDMSSLWNRLESETERTKNHYFSNAICNFNNTSVPQAYAIQVTRGRDGNNFKEPITATLIPKSLKVPGQIITQAPCLSEDDSMNRKLLFWQMAFQQDVGLIVDLTQPTDRIPPYYPSKLNEEQSYEVYGWGKVTVKKIIENNAGLGTVHTYEVSCGGENKLTRRFCYDKWKDFKGTGVRDLQNIIDYIECLETKCSEENSSNNASNSSQTTAVHCRAGVGRSGTLVAARLIKEQVFSGEINQHNCSEKIESIILDLRKRRGPITVQTREQFELLHFFARILLKGE